VSWHGPFNFAAKPTVGHDGTAGAIPEIKSTVHLDRYAGVRMGINFADLPYIPMESKVSVE